MRHLWHPRFGVIALFGFGLGCSGAPTTAANADPLVADCQASASNFARLCAGSDPRPCLWNAYAKLCATGRTQLLVDSMKCLKNTTCRTFSDPNDAASCLAQLHAAGETAAAKSTIQGVCTSCGGSSCSTVSGVAEVLPYLTDAELVDWTSCNANQCTTLAKGCSSSEALAPFAACGF